MIILPLTDSGRKIFLAKRDEFLKIDEVQYYDITFFRASTKHAGNTVSSVELLHQYYS